MQPFLSRHWFKLVTGALVIVILGTIAYQQLFKKTSPYPVDKEAAGFRFENMDGRQVDMKSLDGKVRLVYFFYTSCPDVCSPTTFQMSKIQDILKQKGAFGTKTAFVSVSFDPKRDTREVLTEFAGNVHADPAGWYFLRSDESIIEDLAKQYNAAVFKDDKGNLVGHTNVIALVDAKGMIRHYYIGHEIGMDPNLTPAKVADDMLLLSKE